MIKKLHEAMVSWSPKCILHYADFKIINNKIIKNNDNLPS